MPRTQMPFQFKALRPASNKRPVTADNVLLTADSAAILLHVIYKDLLLFKNFWLSTF